MISLFLRWTIFAISASGVFASTANTFEPLRTRPEFAAKATERKSTLGRAAQTNGDTYVQYGAFFAHGMEGFVRWRTVIGIMNPSDRACNVFVEFLDSRGNPVMAPFHDGTGRYSGDYSGAAATIDPGVNVSPSLMDSRLPAQAAYVRVTSDAGVKVNVDISIVRINGGATHGFVYAAGEANSEVREINVASSPGQNTTLGLLNPGSEPVKVVATARTWEGREACTVEFSIGPGQSIWSSVSLLVHCIRPNTTTHTLRLSTQDGLLVVAGYYEQAGFATAPIHTIPQ